MRILFALVASLFILAATPAVAQRTDIQVELVRTTVTLERDLTGEMVHEGVTKVLTPAGIRAAGQYQFTVQPDTARIEVVSAEVEQPDGTLVPVPAENIVTRPSAVAQRSQGFDRTETTTIVFPKVVVGSRVRYTVRERLLKAPVPGFNYFRTPSFGVPMDLFEFHLDAPADLPLRIAGTDGVAFEDTVEAGRRKVVWQVRDAGRLSTEPGMPNVVDILPVFSVSSLQSWEELGRIYRSQSRDKAEVTPEIAALAREVVADRKGRDAVEAVYNWVATNIRYVQVYLNHAAGYVPNPATEVLRRRYGDCKDYVVLMQAMLAALGIASDPVLVGWGAFERELPVPNAFQFNHAMIYVPAYDIWANPTDSRAPMGSMDAGLAGQFVVVAAEKPFTARLPAPGAEANRYRQWHQLTLREDGTIAGEGQFMFSGAYDTSIRTTLLRGTSPIDTADDMLRATAEGGFGKFKHTNPLDLSTPTEIDAVWESPEILRMDDRILLTVPSGLTFGNFSGLYNFLTRGKRDFPMRSFPGLMVFDTLITLPDGYTVASLPQDTVVTDGPLGTYSATYRVKDGKIHIVRELVLHRYLIPAEDYDAVIALARATRQDLRSVIELVRRPPA